MLLVVAVLAYGLVIPTLGLFGDDWPHLWVYHMFGLDGFSQLVMWDRPFSAWVYWLIAPLAGENIWGYHVYLLLIRWAGAVAFYFVIKEVFPKSQPFPTWAAVFFLVYPGFRQQPQPLEFILHFTVLGLMLLSFLCMLHASIKTKFYWVYQVIGTLAALSIFSVEYFIGLEILRPVFLWMVTKEYKPMKLRLVYIAKIWLPYLVVVAGYVYWRIFVFSFPTYKPTFLSSLFTDPIHSVIELGNVLVEEIRAAVLGAWRQIMTLPGETGANWGYFLLVVLTFVIIFFWLNRFRKTQGNASPLAPILVGGLAVLLAGIPFWITGIPVQLAFPWDRSTLPFMFGVSLLLAGGLLFFRPVLRNILAALIIAFSVGMHYQNTQVYQVEWNKLSQFFWQLSWRAPGLQPGTVVISDAIPLWYYGDNNLTPITNWMYAPESHSTDIPYNFFDMGERLGKSLPDLQPGLPVDHTYRFLNFNSTSDKLFPVFYNPRHCLRVIDGLSAQIKGVPNRLRKTASFSDPQGLITTTSVAVPPAFIPEPQHDWCYFYQKAELASQLHNWEEVNSLWDQALSLNYQPVDKTELIPFIQAKLQTGDFDTAGQLSREVMKQDDTKPVICALWKEQMTSRGQIPGDFESIFDALRCETVQ